MTRTPNICSAQDFFVFAQRFFPSRLSFSLPFVHCQFSSVLLYCCRSYSYRFLFTIQDVRRLDVHGYLRLIIFLNFSQWKKWQILLKTYENDSNRVRSTISRVIKCAIGLFRQHFQCVNCVCMRFCTIVVVAVQMMVWKDYSERSTATKKLSRMKLPWINYQPLVKLNEIIEHKRIPWSTLKGKNKIYVFLL